jgi:arylformamidase
MAGEKLMRVIDISWPITPDITGYKDDQGATFSATHSFERDLMRKSRLVVSSHVGTHVDAPTHFLPEGKTIDQVSLAHLVGSCVVLDLTEIEEYITRQDLEQFQLPKGLILLLKTRNSELAENAPFDPHFIYLDQDAASYCIELGVKAVGIDYIAIERNQPDHKTHQILLSNDTPIVEGLRLGHIGQGFYFFVCLPLAIIGLEAAPARAILIEDFL